MSAVQTNSIKSFQNRLNSGHFLIHVIEQDSKKISFYPFLDKENPLIKNEFHDFLDVLMMKNGAVHTYKKDSINEINPENELRYVISDSKYGYIGLPCAVLKSGFPAEFYAERVAENNGLDENDVSNRFGFIFSPYNKNNKILHIQSGDAWSVVRHIEGEESINIQIYVRDNEILKDLSDAQNIKSRYSKDGTFFDKIKTTITPDKVEPASLSTDILNKMWEEISKFGIEKHKTENYRKNKSGWNETLISANLKGISGLFLDGKINDETNQNAYLSHALAGFVSCVLKTHIPVVKVTNNNSTFEAKSSDFDLEKMILHTDKIGRKDLSFFIQQYIDYSKKPEVTIKTHNEIKENVVARECQK